MPIFKISPVYKDYLWGGDKLKRYYNKQTDSDIVAESWELSTHPDGICKVNDELLSDVLDRHPEYLGKTNELPVLVKFIDSRNALSIQVHPDDDYARKYENDWGKSEAWYILGHEDGAFIYFGFNNDYSKQEIRDAINDNTICDLLNRVDVEDGDVFKIDAGTVHAIGGGITLIEFQQLSNCTYRLYDFDRVDKNGNKRQLHIDKALDVIKVGNNNKKEIKKTLIDDENVFKESLVEIKNFRVEHYSLKKSYELYENSDSYISMTVTDGKLVIDDIELIKGDTLFIAAGNGSHTLKGKAEFVTTELRQ